MSQQQRDAVNQIVAEFPLDVGGDIIEQRAVFEQMMTAQQLPARCHDNQREPRWSTRPWTSPPPARRPDSVLLWFHGGWYSMGSPLAGAALSSDVALTHRGQDRFGRLSARSRASVPRGAEDARAAYRALLDSGVSPRDVAMVGESAGGGLVVSTLASLAEEGLPQPAAAVLFSPWADLTLSGESMTSKAGIDPVFDPEKVRVRVADYVGDADPADPAISPIFADLSGLPPLLIQAGSYEVLLDDSVRLAARAAAADVSVSLEVTPGVPMSSRRSRRCWTRATPRSTASPASWRRTSPLPSGLSSFTAFKPRKESPDRDDYPQRHPDRTPLELMTDGDNAFNTRDFETDEAIHAEMVAFITGLAEPNYGSEARAATMRRFLLSSPDTHVETRTRFSSGAATGSRS